MLKKKNKVLLKEPVDSIDLVQIYSKLKFYFLGSKLIIIPYDTQKQKGKIY